MRAPMITLFCCDSVSPGIIDCESSRLKSIGRSRTCLRIIASGMRGPLGARAKMNTVSSGDAWLLSAGASVTRPETVDLPAAAVEEPAGDPSDVDPADGDAGADEPADEAADDFAAGPDFAAGALFSAAAVPCANASGETPCCSALASLIPACSCCVNCASVEDFAAFSQ